MIQYEEWRLLEVREPVDMRSDPVAGSQHVARDLRLHGIHIVHQGRRRNNAAEIHSAGEEQDR